MPQFPVSGPARLRVSAISGRVDVDTIAGATEVSVDVSPTDPHNDAARRLAEATRVDASGNNITVEVPSHHGILTKPPALDITVTVPDGSTVDLRTATADVTCRGTYAEAGVQTASGDVQLDRVTGTAAIKTASGDVGIQAAGELTANTASGDVLVGESGPLTANTASGDIRIRLGFSDVRLRTASGDVRIDEIRASEVAVQTVSGDISIGVAAGVAAWIDASALSGSVRSSLAIDDARPSGDVATASIRARSVSGDVEVHRTLGAASVS